ncbi:hypothetical protein V866_003181 [Kwoniella sp. B9012]
MSNPTTKRPLDVNAGQPEMAKVRRDTPEGQIRQLDHHQASYLQDFLNWLPIVTEGLQAACDKKEQDYQNLTKNSQKWLRNWRKVRIYGTGRNDVFSLDKRKIVSDMLEKNQELLNNFERSKLRAKVAFKEMNRARKKNGDPVYSKEEFEKVVEKYV